MLDERVYGSQSELARGEGVSSAAVGAALRKLRQGSGVRTRKAPPLREVRGR